MESAIRKDVLDSGQPVDPVEADYRAGVMSVRAVAAKHGLSEGAVRKRAKTATPPWVRNLKPDVDTRVEELLARDGTQAGTQYAPTEPEVRTVTVVRTDKEEEVVEIAARAIVQVVREHRGAIQAGQQMVGMLLGQLQDAAGSRDELEEEIEVMTADDTNGKRRDKLMKAVSLPAHASVIKDLATAMKHLVGLERQAFGISEKADPDPPPTAPVQQDAEDVDFTDLRAAFDKRLSNAAATA